MNDMSDYFEAISKLTKDLKNAAITLSKQEARYLVDSYYTMQENRKRANNQIKALEKFNEPHAIIDWLAKNNQILESNIKRALDAYGKSDILGNWCHSICGMGPVLTAGLLAHIDLEKAPTTGHIWSFAGLDPNIKWYSKEQAKALVIELLGDYKKGKKVIREDIIRLGDNINRKPESLYKCLGFVTDGKKKEFTMELLLKVLVVRPWNAKLKTLCWKIGQSFSKQSFRPECFYGHTYLERKNSEIKRNIAGENKAFALKRSKQVGNGTKAYPWYIGRYKVEDVKALYDKGVPPIEWEENLTKVKAGEGDPMLSPGHITSRSERYAVKLFLSHFHDMGYRLVLGKEPPLPYKIANSEGHVHMIDPPNMSEFVKGGKRKVG